MSSGKGTPRIPRNMGRVEFLACRESITTMHRQGYDNRKIHDALAAKGRVTMAYATFCRYMKRFFPSEGAHNDWMQSRDTPSSCEESRPGRSGFAVNKKPSSGEMI